MAEAAEVLQELAPAEPAVRGARGLYSAAKLGLDPSTCSSAGFNARLLLEGERFQSLAHKERFFRGQQHDHKVFDFNQRMVKAPSGVQPLLGGLQSASYVALDQRRPCAPYRLDREIVKGFTRLVFGRGRWPAINVVGDKMTQRFAEALVRASRMPLVMIRARNLGGACGTVGLSWRYWQGSPRVQVHNARALHVHEWADRELLVPAHVTEVLQYEQDEWNQKEKRVEKRTFWRRRDWTPQADVTFLDVPASDDPEWVIDDSDGATFVHADGFAHFVWVQNQPDLDGSCEDGESDLETLFDNLDMVDVVSSATALGGAKNLDPTLVLDVDSAELGSAPVQKGSDNAIAFKGASSSKYLEISGAAISAGKDLLGEQTRQVRDVAGYVKPDPDKVAAAGTSGRALELLYGPMIAEADTLREQYGRAIEQLLEQMIASAKARMPERGEDGELSYPVEVSGEEEAAEGEEPQEREVDFYVALPPIVEERDVLDATGQITGKKEIVVTELHPGQGGDVELKWGDYFPKSDADLQARATTLSTASGGKPIVSHRTAVELFASELGLDPAAEWKLVEAQVAADKAAQAGMFPEAGMPVSQEQALPEAGGGADAAPGGEDGAEGAGAEEEGA